MQRQRHTGTGEGDGGRITTRDAAAALGVDTRQVRGYIADGRLDATTEGEGPNRRYLVSVDSVEALRAEWQPEEEMAGQAEDRNGAEGGIAQEQDAVTLVRELAAELGEVWHRLGRAEAWLEHREATQSAFEEQLHRERERADRLEAERERLVPDLLRERDLSKAERKRADHLEAELRVALDVRRGWFRRFFGF